MNIGSGQALGQAGEPMTHTDPASPDYDPGPIPGAPEPEIQPPQPSEPELTPGDMPVEMPTPDPAPVENPILPGTPIS